MNQLTLIKTPLLILLLLTIAVSSYGQKTEKKTVRHDNPRSKEIYYVIKDTDTRHGSYQRIGMWEEKGQYSNGQKTGVWEYYGHGGKLEQKYDFTEDSLIFALPFKPVIESFTIDDQGRLKKNTSDETPILLGGITKFYNMLGGNIEYPKEAVSRNITGDVIVSATITREGKLIDPKIEDGPGYGLDEEALRVVKLMTEEWIPLKIDGEKVATRIFIQIRFKLG